MPCNIFSSSSCSIREETECYTECNDFRTISLLGYAAKVLIRVLTKRIEAKANAINYIGKDQIGFRKGKGTRDAIATIRVLGERSLQRGKDLCIVLLTMKRHLTG